MLDISAFEQRKRDHLDSALDYAHQAEGLGGWDRIHLSHDALPELDWTDISLRSICLGQPAPTPFYISGMTAGHAGAYALNRRLARACTQRGWALGVGSQRRDLAEGTSGATDQWKELRAEFPELILFANLGLSQLPGAFTTDVARVVESIRAQALVVHANALQEALQPEGTPQFKGGVAALARLTRELTVPVVLKETGCGFSKNTMLKLRETGLSALDVSGLGGTHWGRIEGARARVADPIRGGAAETFAQWGESTVQSLLTAHELCPELELWGSGGVRSGLDAAKAIALGAHRVGYAQPALAAALQGDEALSRWMEQQEYELKLALFCTGMRDPLALRSGNGLWKTNGN